MTGKWGKMELATELLELARALQNAPDEPAALAVIVRAANRGIRGGDHASVTLMDDTGTVLRAGSDAIVDQADAAQFECHEGPLWEVLEDATAVASDDLCHEERWSSFTARGSALGIRSVISFRMSTPLAAIGALNLYSQRPGAFAGRGSVEAGQLLAAQAAVGVQAVRTVTHLRHVVDFGDVLGQAKGILMERHHLTSQEAITTLMTAADRTGMELREVASELIRTGTLPGDVARGRTVSADRNGQRALLEERLGFRTTPIGDGTPV